MRVANLYKNMGRPVVSFEFFPPRTPKSAETFGTTVDKLSLLNPDYMSVTFGAGGSAQDGSYQTIKKILIDRNIPTVAYIAGYGLAPDEITKVLDQYKELGIETIFVIRGDKPEYDGFKAHPDSFSYASDLLSFIKERYDFTLGCAGYPEGHPDAENIEEDIEYLKLKVENGAEYVVAQYFYDNNYFFNYVDKCRERGIDVPIIPGIMPVYSVKMTAMLSKMCGATITDKLQDKLDKLDESDKDAVQEMGIDFATEQCRDLLNKGVDGLHFYTMDRTVSTTRIINNLKERKML